MSLKKWSEVNTDAVSILKPDFGKRKWGEIKQNEKNVILTHFKNNGWFSERDSHLHKPVRSFSNDHRAGSYCNHLLSHGGPHDEPYNHGVIKNCCTVNAVLDFEHIFLTEHQDVVYELISYYILNLDSSNYRNFSRMFNDISTQFGLNVLLSESGLILRQEEKITKEIYEPVLSFLSDKKWEIVNRELVDAFTDYHKNSPQNFSSCVTHTVSAVQAFLQILISGEVGKGEIAILVKEGIKKGVIPNDPFSASAFNQIVSVLMRERQSKSDSHPKEEYADEKTARLLLNLTMVFMQHCLQV